MSKKIIALSLALMLIVTCFVACGKKYETTKINGKDVILVTDENGDPVINEKNQVIALVTDEAGEVLTHSNGEDQTRYIQLNDALVVKGVAYGKNYKFNVLEGWTVGEVDRIYKDGTENKCYIQFATVKEIDKDENLATYFEKLDQQNDILIDNLKKEGYEITIDKSNDSISEKGIGCEVYKYKLLDSNGKVTHYAENYYFTVGGMIYSVNYACMDGVGYDETFDFGNYLKTNFTFID